MSRPSRIARTRIASGRFLFVTVLAMGCQTAASRQGVGAPVPPRDPVVAQGAISRAGEARAADIFTRAQDALDGGRADEALTLAAQVVEDYPTASVSGRALLLVARSALAAQAWDRAAKAAQRYERLLPPGDDRRAGAVLLQAQAYAGEGDQRARLSTLLALPARTSPDVLAQGADQAREAAAALGRADLEAALERVPEGAPLRTVVLARYAEVLNDAGATELARRSARAALAAGAQGPDSVLADGIASGRMAPHPALTIRLGTVLPTSGSPAFREFAGLVAEGIEVAASTYLGPTARVILDAHDDAGDPTLAAAQVRQLEADGTLGAVGFLETGSLDAAANGREGAMPLVSPTARTASGDGVYTLSGPDPQSATAMAEYAARTGFKRVAIVNSRAQASAQEADAFEAELRSLGVPLAGRFQYDAGQTTFGPPLKAAQEALRGDEIRAAAAQLGPDDTLHVDVATLDPVAIFLPVPPEDVELLAPQVTFFGLDTLGIQVLGTSGWTDAEALSGVDQRHTTGVVATAPVSAGPGSPGYQRFMSAYEEHFQRTLVSPVPALGYDAALLVLDAAKGGARTPRALAAALEGVRDVEGATGIFSVKDGRVFRRTEVVRIEHGGFVPVIY